MKRYIAILFALASCERVVERLPPIPADASGAYAVLWDGMPGSLTLTPDGDVRARGYPCSPNGDRALGVGFWTYDAGRIHLEMVSLNGLTYVEMNADARGDGFDGSFAATVSQVPCAMGDVVGVRD